MRQPVVLFVEESDFCLGMLRGFCESFKLPAIFLKDVKELELNCASMECVKTIFIDLDINRSCSNSLRVALAELGSQDVEVKCINSIKRSEDGFLERVVDHDLFSEILSQDIRNFSKPFYDSKGCREYEFFSESMELVFGLEEPLINNMKSLDHDINDMAEMKEDLSFVTNASIAVKVDKSMPVESNLNIIDIQKTNSGFIVRFDFQ